MEEFMSDVITEQDFINLGWKRVEPYMHDGSGGDWPEGEYFYDYTNVNILPLDLCTCSNIEAEAKGWSFGSMTNNIYSRTILYNMMGLIAQFDEHAAKNME